MAEETVRERTHNRIEALAGWALGILCLVVYLACPNVKMPNGDVAGWAMFLDSYASAQGTIFHITDPRPPGPRHQRLSDEELAALGERERSAGWWVLWHPHHIFYLPVTAAIFRIVRAIEPNFGAITFLQYWNALASAATVLLMNFLLVRVNPRSPYNLPWMLFLASSVTFFHYSTDGSQYPTSIFFLALASGSLWVFASMKNGKYLLRASLWMALAILFHQITSIVVPFLLIGVAMLIRVWRRQGEKISYGNFWTATAISIGVPVFVYVLIGAMALGPTGEFNIPGLIKYATLFAHQREYWTYSIGDGILTNLRTIIGFYFGEARTSDTLFRAPWLTILMLIMPLIWISAVVNIRNLKPLTRWWVILCLLWIFPMLIFLSFWNPGHDFYHLFLTIPLGSLAVIGAESSRHPGKRRWMDIAFFWIWCIASIYVNLPLSLAGCNW